MSFMMIIMWLLLNSRLVLMDGWRERFNKYKKMLPSFLHSATPSTFVSFSKRHKEDIRHPAEETNSND